MAPVKQTLLDTQSREPAAGEVLREKQPSLAEALEASGLDRMSQEDRVAIIKHARPDDYIAAVSYLHQLVAPETPQTAQMRATEFRNRKGEVTGKAAEPEDRYAIMAHALDAAQRLIAQYETAGGDRHNLLTRCGNLLALGTVLAHYFNDGNGRTARTLGELVQEGFDGTDPSRVEALKVVSSPRPTKGWSVNSYVPKGDWGGGRANAAPFAFLDAVAAFEAPFDEQAYIAASTSVYMSPHRS